jgi:hypothetical protein
MQRSRSALAVIIAPAKAGKTTLLASLYEQLARGPVGDWEFMASRSLVGFERRSWLATWESQQTAPDTSHTSMGTDQILLHLRIRNPNHVRDVLLTDLSGEFARLVIELDDLSGYEAVLGSASCVLLVVDGARLAVPASRHQALANLRVTTRAIVENSLLRESTTVTLVVTKWDLCHEVDGLNPELERLREDTEHHCERPVMLLRTSARSSNPPPETEGSLATLLDLASGLPERRKPRRAEAVVHQRASANWTPGSRLLVRLIRGAK